MGHASRRRCCRCYLVRMAILMVVISSNAMASRLSIESSLLVSETYSDNLDLEKESNPKRSGLVTIVKPEISASLQGRRLKFDLNYFLQNTSYSKNINEASSPTLTNYLFRSVIEPARDEFFIDIVSSRSQLTSVNGFIDGTSYLLKNEVSNVKINSITPKYRAVISGSAEINLSASLQNVKTDGGEFAKYRSLLTNVDIESLEETQSLLSWSASYSSTDRRSDENLSEEFAQLDISYKLYKNIDYLALAGYIDSELSPSDNKSYSAVGFGWHPSSKFELDLYGGTLLRRARLLVRPSSKASLVATWSDANFGANSGDSWEGVLDLKSRSFTFQAVHFEEVISYQQLLAGNLNSPQINNSIAPLDDIFIRSRNSVSLTIARKKIDVTLKAYDESRKIVRTISQTGNDSGSAGGDFSVAWKVTPQLRGTLQYGIQNLSDEGAVAKDQLVYSILSLRYSSRRNFNVEVIFRSSEQVAERTGSRNYIENRASLKVDYTF